MLPVIEKDVVDRYKLCPRDRFLEYATLSQTLPGVIALNCASFVGREAAGLAGMIAAGLGAVLPAFVLMVAATALTQLIPREGAVQGAFYGIRAASAALVLSAAVSLGQHNIKTLFSALVAGVVFLLLLFSGVGAVALIILAAAVGCLYNSLMRRRSPKQ